MVQGQAAEAAFARAVEALVRENRQSLPGETGYFLTHQRRHLSELRLIEKLCTGGRILEVGGYPFFFTCILQKCGFPVTSIDLHPGRAARFVRRYGLNVVACNIERQRLPFADGTFQYVIFTEVFEHLRIDPLLALSEANRVLASGGSLLLTTPNLYFIKTVLKFLLGRGFNDPLQEFGKLRSVGHMGHVREYSLREVRRFVEASGFAVQSQRLAQYNYPRNLFGAVSYPLLCVLPFLQGTQVVIATKTAAGPNLAPLARG